MAMLETALETTILHLQRLRRPVVEELQPGADVSEIVNAFAGIGLVLPNEAVDLWRWRNGTRIVSGVTKLDDIHFFPGFYFFSYEDALKQYAALRDDLRWNSAWLPVFANGGGDFYALDLAGGDARHAPVVGFILGEDEHPTEYENLERMCQTIAVCFERGVFFVSEQGYLDADDDGHAFVARQLNPSVILWKQT